MWRRVLILLALVSAALLTGSAQAAKVATSAAITSFDPSCAGISLTATGSYQGGINRTDFRLIDLNKDPTTSLVDEKVTYYEKPLPREVSESWTSMVALTPDTPYRVFFLVWAKVAGINEVVASDRRDFTCTG